ARVALAEVDQGQADLLDHAAAEPRDHGLEVANVHAKQAGLLADRQILDGLAVQSGQPLEQRADVGGLVAVAAADVEADADQRVLIRLLADQGDQGDQWDLGLGLGLGDDDRCRLLLDRLVEGVLAVFFRRRRRSCFLPCDSAASSDPAATPACSSTTPVASLVTSTSVSISASASNSPSSSSSSSASRSVRSSTSISSVRSSSTARRR